MNNKSYKTKGQVFEKAETILHKTLRDVVSHEQEKLIENQIGYYGLKRKGLLGDLIEKYFFDINPGSVSSPDFFDAKVELKTTPLKIHPKKSFASKERLVFSMIDYINVIKETWESSSFLKKNRTLLLMFYLWVKDQTILDYEFEFVQLLDLLEDISDEDVLQIRRDWEYIVAKIKRGEAHLLSEGDTYYLGACTKAANSRVVRDQPLSNERAKPRAFSFKQQYLNYLIQTKLLSRPTGTDSIFKKLRRVVTIEEAFTEVFCPYVGKTDREILSKLNSKLTKNSKGYKRLIINQIIGVSTRNILELNKANITLRVITLENSGTLKESISFPSFDYKDLVTQSWYDKETEMMADFHLQLETKKFLFVVFQKQKNSDNIILLKTLFWNFPMKDIDECERVWQKTVDCIKEWRYADLPKISESRIAHVRPHGKNSKDTITTPQNTQEVKRSFWLNAKYVQNIIKNN